MTDVLLKRILRTVDDITEVHSEEVVPLLQKHEDHIGNLQEDVRALFEVTEMNFLVLSYALMNDLFEEDDPEEVSDRLNQLQDKYLACMSIANFLSHLGSLGEEEEEED